MGVHSTSSLFSNFKSSDANLNNDHSGSANSVIVKACPLGMIRVDKDLNTMINLEDGGVSGFEPCLGLEFDSADNAREFYSAYASRMGFKIRIGQLYRSRSNGIISSRRYVCSKEGFQLSSRSGCPAFIRVQWRDSGKWVIDQINKDHNHELGVVDDSHSPVLQQRTPRARKSYSEMPQKSNFDNGQPHSSSVLNAKRIRREGGGGEIISEPRAGLLFSSADEAYSFYQMYAEAVGFRIRIGQLFRSKNDGSVTSRRFVCSKEGFQHPSRSGCGAFMRIKRQESGAWIVDRLQKDHNHDLERQVGNHKKNQSVPKKFVDDMNLGLDPADIDSINAGDPIERTQEKNIGSDWYSLLLDYFQSRQADDTGFFHSMKVDDGRCTNVFWADSRSRFSCSQFGDAIVLDTSYRNCNFLVPFATFVGVNHHKQPVLLACALIANMSEQSFTWLFRTWLRAMSGCQPKCIIADQDMAIQQAIAKVFPGTHHRFSVWQIKANELENFQLMPGEFKYDYENCIYQSQTSIELNAMWSALINKYDPKDNIWLREMYEKRESWVPLYLRGKFYAGIPISESMKSFFDTTLTAETSPREFISRYEQGLLRRREEERKEDLDCYNLQALLQTKDPVEEQCRKIYTLTVFKIFQNELLECYNYLGIKTYEEGTVSRYLVRRSGNAIEKYAVTLSASNLNVCCTCQMFEFEGILCRHILRVFNLLDIREIPSRYILHRWTRNAEYGTIHDVECGVSPQELKSIITWSLRETACKYVEAGASSFEKFKLAYETMRDGGRKLQWQR